MIMNAIISFIQKFYFLIVGLLFSIIASTYILSFFGIYHPVLFFLLTIILSGTILFFLFKGSGDSIALKSDDTIESSKKSLLPYVIWISTLLVFLLFIFYPLSTWPYPSMYSELHWDAGAYHFPKAAEMISTGSSWDLSISYGEYPFGYESLISFLLLIDHQGQLIGLLHAVSSLFFLLSIVFCFKRVLKLSHEIIFMIIVVMFISNKIVPTFDSNLWWIFWSQLMQIGKNDLILAAASISILIFTPRSYEEDFHPLELSLASMIAISIKPNGLLIVLFAWSVVLFHVLKRKRFIQHKEAIISAITVIPGSLWIFRNLVAQRVLFSEEALRLSDWSIISNITNPYFFRYIPQHMLFIIGILIMSAIISIFVKSIRFELLTTIVFLISFAMTPASAFFGSTNEPTQIAWRFALPLLINVLLLLLLLIEPIIFKIYEMINKNMVLSIVASVTVIILSFAAVWMNQDLFETNSQNRIILSDQYHEAVGVDGYHSAYDFVQKNISNSIIIIENGLPYYLYDDDFTNSVTRSKPADYMVFLKTAWIDEGGYPETLSEITWNEQWNLIYEDPEGRVYQRN